MEINRLKNIQPAIKWSGSKRYVAKQLYLMFPSSNRFFDPFVGGGAILPYVTANEIIVGDIIPELINLWRLIKYNPNFVAEQYKYRWEKFQELGHSYYYHIRDHFNITKNPLDFMFLIRTCVNGLIRFNKAGEFNSPVHLNRPGINPKTLHKILLFWSYKIKNIHFVCQDYTETLKMVHKGDNIFLDPPYTGTKQYYLANKFNYAAFFSSLEHLNTIGAKYILTLDGRNKNYFYDRGIPKTLYMRKLEIYTGKSSFLTMKGQESRVYESVYLNF